jgi:hypothetical protein
MSTSARPARPELHEDLEAEPEVRSEREPRGILDTILSRNACSTAHALPRQPFPSFPSLLC